jgi:hypothetical protein
MLTEVSSKHNRNQPPFKMACTGTYTFDQFFFSSLCRVLSGFAWIRFQEGRNDAQKKEKKKKFHVLKFWMFFFEG